MNLLERVHQESVAGVGLRWYMSCKYAWFEKEGETLFEIRSRLILRMWVPMKTLQTDAIDYVMH
jgi:hypothetical protein